MSLLKNDSYGTWTFDLGDEQLKVSASELTSAINMENITDRIFARVLKNRSRAHQMLLDKVPAAKEDSK